MKKANKKKKGKKRSDKEERKEDSREIEEKKDEAVPAPALAELARTVNSVFNHKIDPDEVNSVEEVNFLFIEIKNRLISLLTKKKVHTHAPEQKMLLREVAKMSSFEHFDLWQTILMDVIKMALAHEDAAPETEQLLACAQTIKDAHQVSELVALFYPLRILNDTLRDHEDSSMVLSLLNSYMEEKRNAELYKGLDQSTRVTQKEKAEDFLVQLHCAKEAIRSSNDQEKCSVWHLRAAEARYYLQQYEDVIADVDKGLPKSMLDSVLSKARESPMMFGQSEYNRSGEITERQALAALFQKAHALLKLRRWEEAENEAMSFLATRKQIRNPSFSAHDLMRVFVKDSTDLEQSKDFEAATCVNEICIAIEHTEPCRGGQKEAPTSMEGSDILLLSGDPTNGQNLLETLRKRQKSMKQSSLESRVQEHEANEEFKQAIQLLKDAKEHGTAYPDPFSRSADKLIANLTKKMKAKKARAGSKRSGRAGGRPQQPAFGEGSNIGELMSLANGAGAESAIPELFQGMPPQVSIRNCQCCSLRADTE
jgi:hypothetical protein